jgi:hypothetical protein
MVMNLGIILLGIGMYQTLINKNEVELTAENMSTGKNSGKELEELDEKGEPPKKKKASSFRSIEETIIINPFPRMSQLPDLP